MDYDPETWVAEIDTGSSQVVSVPLGATLVIQMATTVSSASVPKGRISVRCAVQGKDIPLCTLDSHGESQKTTFVLPEGYAAELRVDWVETYRAMNGEQPPKKKAKQTPLGKTPVGVTLHGIITASAACLPILDNTEEARDCLDGHAMGVAEALGSQPATPNQTPVLQAQKAVKKGAKQEAVKDKSAGVVAAAAAALARGAKAVPQSDEEDDSSEDEDAMELDEAMPGDPVSPPNSKFRSKKYADDDSDQIIEIESLPKLNSQQVGDFAEEEMEEYEEYEEFEEDDFMEWDE